MFLFPAQHLNIQFWIQSFLIFCCRTSSQKYAPLDWAGYFDREDDVSIPGSNDVSGFAKLFFSCSFSFLILWDHHLCLYVFSGLSCLLGRNTRTSYLLFAWRWLYWVCLIWFLSRMLPFALSLWCLIAFLLMFSLLDTIALLQGFFADMWPKLVHIWFSVL